MRQAGVLAAAVLYALEHHVDRLTADHAHAAWLASAISGIEGLALATSRVETNMIIFRIDPALGSAAEFCAQLKERGLLVLPVAAQSVRAVTHLDVDTAAVHRAGAILEETAEELRKTPAGAAKGSES